MQLEQADRSWISRAMKVDSVQVSSKLRRSTTGLMCWCPACEEMHPLPDSWTFDGNLESPTFSPSFKHTTSNTVCHYVLTAGVLNYCGDCTHAMAGQSVPLPELPEWLRDAA